VFPLAPNSLRILANAVVTPIAQPRVSALDREQPAGASSNA
jgi:hypothetical protein